MKLALRMVGVSVVALMLGMVLGVRSAHAATSTWTGGGADTNMTTAGNWDSAPVGDGSDVLVFPITVTNRTVVNDFPADTGFTSITFSGVGTTGGSYFLSGARMVITGGITISQTGYYANSPRIDNDIVFTGDQSLTVAQNDSLEFSGVLSGTGDLTKSGTGYIYLSRVNTFSGSLDIAQGVVNAYSPSALGSAAGGTTIADGAYLLMRFQNSDKNATIAEPFTLNGTSGGTSGDKCPKGGLILSR